MKWLDVAQTVVLLGALSIAIASFYFSRRDRASDAAEARIGRVYDAVLNIVEVAETQAGTAAQDPAMRSAQTRLNAAVALAGGPGQWGGTDLLARTPIDRVSAQAQAAMLEIVEKSNVSIR